MIDEQLWAEARRLFHVEHLSKSEIARRLQLDRDTVSRALGTEVAPQYTRPPRGSIVAPHGEAVRARLREYPDISAARLFTELRAAGYGGGYSALNEVVRELRPRSVEAFLRRETEPGQEAQVDWGSFGVLEIGGARRPLSCFVIVLGYSRMLYLSFTVSQRMEDFLRGHVEAFQFFGGVPHRILYDNLRSVVLARSGSTVRFHPRFTEFAGVHLFEPRPCGRAQAARKGKGRACHPIHPHQLLRWSLICRPARPQCPGCAMSPSRSAPRSSVWSISTEMPTQSRFNRRASHSCCGLLPHASPSSTRTTSSPSTPAAAPDIA